MYYKIENKESEVYKKLYAMRIEEYEFEEQNKEAIKEKTGLEWGSYLGHQGQQNFDRVTSYSGFAFKDASKVDLKVWKQHDKHKEIFVPNRRTKAGREMSNFLTNGLKRHWYMNVFDNLGIEHPAGRFKFPFVEVVEDVIIMYMDDYIDQMPKDVVEITKSEFYSIYESKKETA